MGCTVVSALAWLIKEVMSDSDFWGVSCFGIRLVLWRAALEAKVWAWAEQPEQLSVYTSQMTVPAKNLHPPTVSGVTCTPGWDKLVLFPHSPMTLFLRLTLFLLIDLKKSRLRPARPWSIIGICFWTSRLLNACPAKPLFCPNKKGVHKHFACVFLPS